MTDVTPVLDDYRECVRNLWNTRFRDEAVPFPDAEVQDIFEEIAERLFQALVLRKLGRPLEPIRLGYEPVPFLRVVPSPEDGVPIMIQQPRPGDPNNYWDDPVSRVSAPEVKLAFVGYFDWEPYRVMDCRYYLVRIEAFGTQPHLVGRRALVETIYARVLAS